MRCLRCGDTIPQSEAKKIKEAEIDPFCSQYCAEIYGGMPLPYNSAIHNRLKWDDINKQRKLEHMDTLF